MVNYDIDYFTNGEWGEVVDDDKYWDEDLLFENFIVFYVHAFAWLNLPRPTYNQLLMAKHVSDTSNKSRMLMALRGLSKSLTSQIYAVWRLYRDPDEHILVMSASGTRAKNFTAFMQKIIRLFPCTQHMAPRHNIERTSGGSFDVAGASESDSPSVYAVGVENQIAGFRATLVIYDDIESKQNSTSITMREKIDHYAKEAHNLLIAGKEETITLCTPHSKDSIYIGWITEGHVPLVIPSEYVGKDHFLYQYIAEHIRKRAEKFPSLIGKATDERITKKILEDKMLKIGRSEYKLQYLLDVSESDDIKHPLKLSDLIVMDVDDDQAPLKIAYSSMPENQLYIKHNGFKADKLFRPSYVSDEKTNYQIKIMAVDPSGKGADETAYAVIFILNGRVFIKDVGGFSGGYDDETLGGLARLVDEYGVNTLILEENFGGGSFGVMLNKHLMKLKKQPEVFGVRAKGQKETRIINAVEPLLNQHKIIIDKSLLDRDSRGIMLTSLTYQLSHLTRERDCLKHDDRVDALEMAISHAIELYLDVDEERSVDLFKERELEDIMKMNHEMFADSPHFYRGSLNYAGRY